MCNADDDMYFLILLQNFKQYLISRRKPPILYNFSIRTRILDNADGDEFIVNDVYAVVMKRPYAFWLLTGESTASFQNIVVDVSQNLNLHGKEITSVQNRILLTLIWFRQYPTYTLLSMSFGISIATVLALLLKKDVDNFVGDMCPHRSARDAQCCWHDLWNIARDPNSLKRTTSGFL